MNIVNEDIIRAILTNEHPDATIRILDWHVDENIVKPGNNYATEVSRLTIRYERDHHAPAIKILFLKVPSKAPTYEMLKNFGTYENEMLIYTKILPQMYLIDGHTFTAPMYHFDDKMSLFLDDLSQSGYKCASRVDQLDFEHCFYALRCLAKFHALSVKLEQTGDLPESIKIDPFEVHNNQTEETVNGFLKAVPMFVQSLPQHLRDQHPETISRLNSFNRESFLQSIANSSPFSVLNHGDFWTNNIMFKYDRFGNVEKVKLIDFQLTSWRNPARDLIYFTVTSMKYETYREYFPLLMRLYLDTLNKSLAQFDCPGYDMQSLLHDIDTMHPFTLIVLCCVLPIIISDPDDPIDTKEFCKNDTFEMSCAAKAYKMAHFKQISSKWFEHLARAGSLSKNEG